MKNYLFKSLQMSENEEYHEEEEEEISKIPKDVLHYAYKIADLQNLLMDLTPENIDDSIQDLKDNQYTTDKSLLKSFISHLLEVPDFRPAKISLLCDFMNKLFESIQSEETIKSIQDELLRQLFLSVSNPGPFPNESSRPHFLFQLYQKGVLSIESINGLLQKFIDNYTWFCDPVAWLVCYFFDLVPEDIYEEARRRVSRSKDVNPLFKKFFDDHHYGDPLENAERKSMNPYVEMLRNDDVEGLNTLLNPLYNYDFIIKPSIFEECWFIQREPSLILCAAYFGSVKCFKFLMLNHASLQMRDQDSRSLAQFAVAGGNIEIIRLVEQAGCDFSDTIHIATHFCHPDIFEWLHLTKFPDLTKDNFDVYSILHHAAYSGSIGLLVKCINSGCDVNKFTNPLYRQTPILKAAENGKSDAVKILLSVPEIDPNVKCNSETPLIFAARNGRDECVKLLCNSEKVKVNTVADLGTALHYAAAYCQTDVVRILLDSERIDISIRNQKGETAYNIAQRARAYEVQNLLSGHRSFFSPFFDFLSRYGYLIVVLLLIILSQ